MLKTFKYFTTILAISFLLTACSQKVVVEKPTILEVKQDTIVELSKQANDKFLNQEEQKRYEEALYNRIRKFDFVESWKTRKMYSLSGKRLKEIMRWLNYEEKEDQATI